MRFLGDVAIVWTAVMFSAVAADAQIRIDTARMTVGSRGTVAVRLTENLPGANVTLTGRVTLSNPTVFFPDSIRVPIGSSDFVYSLVRRNDSTFDFSLVLRRTAQSRDTLCLFSGEVLAGSDSISFVRLSGLNAFINNTARIIPSTSGVIVSRTLGAPLTYVRVAKLDPSVPNPAPRNQVMTWAYRIDKDSEVTIILYNALGQEVKQLPQGFQRKGTRFIRFAPSELDFGVGRYWARLVTNSGEDVQSFFIGEW
jgi:hypothetical protein